MISNKIYLFHQKIISSQSPDYFILLIRGLLYILSIAYLLISQIRAYCYKKKIFKTHIIKRPVIAVGNISVGGTGKSPFCIELIQMCLHRQILPGLVSRGYGNDESKIYQNRFPDLPMGFSGNRVKSCNDLILLQPAISIFILDDAFQHQKIHRNVNILLINANDPFGHHFCLPRGFLRESLSAMNRASIIILTHADEINAIEKKTIIETIHSFTVKNISIIEATHEPDYFLSPNGEKIQFAQFSKLGISQIALLCGIAQPAGFVNTLKKCHVIGNKFFFYADHYQYLSNDFKIIAKERKSFDCLITTEKDIVKIPLDIIKELNIYTLVMKMHLSESEKIMDLIKEAIQ